MDTSLNNLGNSIERLQKMIEMDVELNCKPLVYEIIANKVTDIDTIEHLLDRLLDNSITEAGSQLFHELCEYYKTINENHAKDYLGFYKEQYED